MTIEFNPKKAANLLKAIVNQSCEDGFLWYPNIVSDDELKQFMFETSEDIAKWLKEESQTDRNEVSHEMS